MPGFRLEWSQTVYMNQPQVAVLRYAIIAF